MASENEGSDEYMVSATQSIRMASENEGSVSMTQISRAMASESEGSETGNTRQMSNLMSTSIPLFSYTDIERATNYLSESSRMWSWRYGICYKGYLDDGTEIAIVMLDPKLPQDEADFIQELNVLEDLRHPNLGELAGACIEHGRHAVLYKIPPYGNLEDFLKFRPGLLTWQIRTSIIHQICSALIFLYSNKQQPIIHGDLTPAYIRIDANFNCRVWKPEGTATSNPNPVGRFTEYIETGNRKLADDLYSLGIMVLRLLTGLPAATIEGQAHGASLVAWSMAKVNQSAGNWPSEVAEELAYFGAKCCYNSHLWHMEDVKKELGNFLVTMDNFKNKEGVVYSDYKLDTKSIRRETSGTTSEDTNLNILSSTSTSNVKVFSYSDIERATDGFSETSKIGKGAYGSVYKGSLHNTEVAIKMLDVGSRQGQEEFIQELDVLGQMRHPSLVKLIGACFKHRSLVYEFVPNGSLEDCLKNRPTLLTWQMRTRMVYQICLALIYLHSNKPQPLLHGDLKPANILLDANYNIKLADFGLCRFLPEGTNSIKYHKTENFKGTFWFIDPDYLETGNISTGCDVYSFGVTILMILTGKSPAGIIKKVREEYERKSFMEMVDSAAGTWPDDVAEYLTRIGLKCCNPEGSSRSELMMEMSSELKNILNKIGS